MSLSINAAFDSGNIRLLAIDGDRVDLEIVKDHQSDFFQWFYFRVAGGTASPRRPPSGAVASLFGGVAGRATAMG